MSGAERTHPNPSLPRRPDRPARIDSGSLGIAAGLAALIGSAVALASAPLVVDESYSWVEHDMSASAGQGVDGAWLARTGFLLQGFAFIWIAYVRRERWGQPATALLATVALAGFGGAAYSLDSWLPNTRYDPTEVLLHNLAGIVASFAFLLGVVVVALRLRRMGHRWRALDVVALAAPFVLSGMRELFPSVNGVLQRLLLVVVFVWYGRELLTRGEAST